MTPPCLCRPQKVTRSDSERSFSVGCLAECLEYLGEPAVRQLFPQLLPIFLAAAGDTESEDVQSNAVFGLGELAVSDAPLLTQTALLTAVIVSELTAGEPGLLLCLIDFNRLSEKRKLF